ncbi:MAG: mannosyl-oligosaccharide alpha-1,2-mannosidase [Peltula sp. TS41687]|nr:MAG: mannosyl-oligosaccharide alpha-1,2-mannosidase [Peltula sp. TS41687]
MSFNIPGNVPDFDDPQRRWEDNRWGSSGVGGHARHTTRGTTAAGAGARIGGFFEKKELPMYKDKPYSYAVSNRHHRPRRRKRIIAGAVLVFLALLYWLGYLGPVFDRLRIGVGRRRIDWNARREHVKEAFISSWDAYDQHAWGHDEFHPLSKKGRQMVPGGLGWIIIDSLDTLILMNLTSRLSHARDWISTSLSYEKNHEVNTFETTIRMLGGLLSAHYLSTTFPDMAPLTDDNVGAAGEDLYLEKATDLADRLLGAFSSASGIPYASVNLESLQGVASHLDAGASSTAEAASLQLEFKYLSYLTGEKHYWDKVEKVTEVIDGNGVQDGLVPIFIHPDTGTFRGENIRLGSRGDSYYEYLIKQYLQTSKQEPIYGEMWDQALAGIRKHLITYTKSSNLTIIGELQSGFGGKLSPKMDHLVCFMPGTIALSVTGGLSEAASRATKKWSPKQEEEMRLARELMQTCWGMYKVTSTGLAPEITYFNIYDPPLHEQDGVKKPPLDGLDGAEDADWRSDYIIKSQDSHNLQRPETVESLFYLWRITGDEKYRHWGWEMFQSFVDHTAVNHSGYTSLDNVNEIPARKRDNMESFWLAETLKYFYLLFSPPDLLPLDRIVINTEAHIFPRFELGKLFSTGWKRKPRGSDGNLLQKEQFTLKQQQQQQQKQQEQESIRKSAIAVTATAATTSTVAQMEVKTVLLPADPTTIVQEIKVG